MIGNGKSTQLTPNILNGLSGFSLNFFQSGLAYVDEKPVWWCPKLRAVLANEEVVDGKSEVGNHPVERRNLRQVVLRITAYAEKLLAGLDDLDHLILPNVSKKHGSGDRKVQKLISSSMAATIN